MSEEYTNDNGIAYIWFMLVVLLIVGAIMWMALSGVFNQFIGIFNGQIADGTVSEQTKQAVNFNMLAMGSVPIFLIVGTFIYSIMAAVNKGRT
jgi:hypothetical protein